MALCAVKKLLTMIALAPAGSIKAEMHCTCDRPVQTVKLISQLSLPHGRQSC